MLLFVLKDFMPVLPYMNVFHAKLDANHVWILQNASLVLWAINLIKILLNVYRVVQVGYLWIQILANVVLVLLDVFLVEHLLFVINVLLGIISLEITKLLKFHFNVFKIVLQDFIPMLSINLILQILQLLILCVGLVNQIVKSVQLLDLIALSVDFMLMNKINPSLILHLTTSTQNLLA